jgi:hypothetical protein
MSVVRVAVSGSRTICNKEFIFSTLDFYLSRLLKENEVIIVHGNAKGVDYIANDWAIERGLKTIIYEPDYSKYLPKLAPIKRNQQIIDEADYLIAITTGSNGTTSTIKMAEKKGIPIKTVKI